MKVKELQHIVGEGWVITDEERMADYLVDETAVEVRPQPAGELVLVKPASSQEVSSILKLANNEGIPVFPRGGGTGLCGGAIPTENGIILSLERMKEIAVDQDNLMAIAEAGVTLKELIEKVEQEGLFFPPHPGDQSAQIGGLVACNAGGSRAVKYGVIRNYVKGIDAVLATGEVLRLGGKLLKNNTGYDLMHLIIGSEGTLAVITRVILRLFPQLGASVTMIIPYDNRHDAINTVPKILQSGVIPLAIEYMERGPVELSAAHLNMEWPCKTGVAYLMIIVEGRSEEEVYSDCERISEICERYHGLEAVVGKTRKEQERVLKIRSNMYLALKHKIADSLDAAVPPASMGTFMDDIDKIAARFGTSIPMHGHAGDGNLHPHLMKDLLEKGAENLKEVKRKIYREAVKLGGVMTAEHGLGRIRLPDLDIFLGQKEMELMAGIKKVFDRKGILNPGCAIKME
ncbi:MAG: FAD-binding oxidoreductase [Dehalococcoidia bacterium]|nr:putative FAD-linked oxidoreductase [Chloroflexota bacterium]MBT9162980.1 putative FAD-linked oxidoreductase [Chloroflexota bacterium]